jgi:hypothetical protein
MRTTRSRRGWRFGGLIVCALTIGSLAYTAGTAWAHHMDGWVHDHSSDVIKARPDGLSEISKTYGPVCGDDANAARSYWPSQDQNGAGYVYYHLYIGKNVGGNIRNHVEADHKNGAVRWLVGRLQLSVHQRHDELVVARMGRGGRHEQRDQPGRPGPLERTR